jgi:hypothetical protein
MARYVKTRGYDILIVVTERNARASVRKELTVAIDRE